MKLHKLSNGSWIDLKTVTGISALARVQCWEGGPTHPARVVVHAGTVTEVVACDDYEQAAAMRDELAGLVNAAPVD